MKYSNEPPFHQIFSRIKEKMLFLEAFWEKPSREEIDNFIYDFKSFNNFSEKKHLVLMFSERLDDFVKKNQQLELEENKSEYRDQDEDR